MTPGGKETYLKYCSNDMKTKQKKEQLMLVDFVI